MELALYKRVARIEDLVDVETSADDAEKSKPHPDIFETAVSRLGIASADIVVVGDAPYDAEAAEGAGLRTVGLLCGGSAEADLRRRDASRSIGIQQTSSLTMTSRPFGRLANHESGGFPPG